MKGTILLTGVEFERSILKIAGTYEGMKIDQLYVREKKSGQKVRLEMIDLDEKSFQCRLVMLGCNDGFPLPTGKWEIVVCSGEEYIAATASPELYNKIYMIDSKDDVMNLVIDKADDDYYYVFSQLNENDNRFYLKVSFEAPDKRKTYLGFLINLTSRFFKSILSRTRKDLFKLLFTVINKMHRKNGKNVLFTSDSRAEIGGNEKFVYDRMVELGMDKEYNIRCIFKPSIEVYRSVKDKFLFTYYLATSDYIFVDDFLPELYQNRYDEHVKIIQLWHACGAFKTIGFERLWVKGAPGFMSDTHKCYTHIPVSSQHAGYHNSEAFGLPIDRFYPVGVPRTDIFFDEEYKKEVVERMYREFPQIKREQRVILYAPTFRGNGAKTAYFPIHMLNYEKLGEMLRRTNSVMIIKMHPFVDSVVQIPKKYEDVFIDASGYREVNDILFITDVLVTDYSSVIYEMSLLKKPMLFYAFDLNSYVGSRGFYKPYEDIVPGKIVYSMQELLTALENEEYDSEKLDDFIHKNFAQLDGKATDRVIELIFGKR